MHSFNQLTELFEQHFNQRHFPAGPQKLYDAAQYILDIGGKRIRPVTVLMANELLGGINEDAYHIASAIEIFHNFTLIHDDIMDKAPLRRGKPTAHFAYGENTAILAGDVMFAEAYEKLASVKTDVLKPMLQLFTKTAKQVCEGQQMDMDFESNNNVTIEAYLQMITLKTSVLLAASLQMGAMVGGASTSNQHLLYEFGKNLGIAFQIQDDYLDAFGNPEKFGKQPGGDILSNKKTFLFIRANEQLHGEAKIRFQQLMQSNTPNKVELVLKVYEELQVPTWAKEQKEKYYQLALKNLDDVAVLSNRKAELQKLASYLIIREH